MTKHKFTSLLFATGLILAGIGCGSDTNQLGHFGNYSSGFGVVSAFPNPDQTWVPLTTDITLTFSEPVDVASLSGTFTLTKYVAANQPGSQVNNVTYQAGGSNTIVVFDLPPNTQLGANATYVLTLSAAVRSVSGHTMVSPLNLTFYTGAGPNTGFGTNNDPNSPPHVTANFDLITMDACIGATFQFNEDLITAPTGRVDYSGLWGILPSGSSPVMFVLTNPPYMNSWTAVVGCGCQFFNWGDKYKIKVDTAYDLDQLPLQASGFDQRTVTVPMFGPCG
jgi:hypothetical protein